MGSARSHRCTAPRGVWILAVLLTTAGCLGTPTPPARPIAAPATALPQAATPASGRHGAATPAPRLTEVPRATPPPVGDTPAPLPPVPLTPVAAAPTTATPAPLPQVPVLCYHLINVPAGGAYNVSARHFAEQMRWLYNQHYQTIGPEQLLAAIGQGTPLPPHPVLITFDDAQVSPYIHAVPILKQYGFTATFFIMTVRIGQAGALSAPQIQALTAAGFTIGGHTWNHPILARQSPAQINLQLDRSAADLTALLGRAPIYFAYPDGLYNAQVVAALQAHGYRAAFRLQDRHDPVVDPAFMIPRRIIPDGPLQGFITRVHAMESPPP